MNRAIADSVATASPMRAGATHVLSALVAIALGLGATPVHAQQTTQAVTASGVAHPDLWPSQHSPIRRDARLEARVQALLAQLSIEEKVGQIIQADISGVTPDDVRTYHLGSVLAGGNSEPDGHYNAPASRWLSLADEFYRASVDTSRGGHGIPLLLGIDAVHGHNNVVGATLFPHNIGLGAARDPKLMRAIAEATAVELRVTGFDWTFAPTVTVPRDDRWGRTYEGYGENPALVSSYATEIVRGLQGKVGTHHFLDADHVLASAKHFIGDGGTFEGKDKGDTRVSETELRDIHGAGYFAALHAGTQTVMASFSSWNGVKMHGNHSLLTDVLKSRLGFDGFVVGDWDGHGAVPGCSIESCPAAINAGLDMFMAPESWRGLYKNTVAQVRDGTIAMARLDDAVTRILRVKMRLGLFNEGLPSSRPLGGRFDQLGSPAHRALARRAVRESLVLLKNNHHLLPLDPHLRVLVAGDGADNIGKQAGGWTLSWQGTGTQPVDFPNAQSIWSGIQDATAAAGGHAELSVGGQYQTRPDVAIVVFGEEPYAEYMGDVSNLAYQPGKERDLALLRRLQAAGIPVVSVFLSGRPLWVNREINASDAFVAAWLPGSEGGGVADVLFRTVHGKVAHDFHGKLSQSWPMTAVQGPLNIGQVDYHPLFAYGYGLRYRDSGDVSALPEVSGVRHEGSEPGLYFDRGAVAAGWALWLADGDAPGHAVATLPSGDLAHGLTVRAADHLAQEDARRLQWHGGAPARIWLQADEPQDLSRESMSGASLVITLKATSVPDQPVSLGMSCGQDCRGRMDVGAKLRSLPAGTWTRVAFPLNCFASAGADLNRIDGLFELSTAGEMDISVSRIALGTEADQTMTCPAP